jgi:hypothetical protein
MPRELTAASDPRITSEPDFEIALARVRLVQLVRAQEAAPEREWLTYERSIINYLDLIFSLTEAAARRKRRGPDLEAILNSLRHSYVEPHQPGPGHSNLIRTSALGPESKRD